MIPIPSFGHGFERAIGEVVTGLITVAIIQSFLASSNNLTLIIIVNILCIAGVVSLINVIPFWSIAYLLGWIVGILLLGTKTTLLPWWEVVLYFGVGIFFLFVKFRNQF